MDPRARLLLAAATRPYIEAGRAAWYFARGKLRYDPVFLALLRRGLLPDRGRLLDVGCGRGQLLALLAAAANQYERGLWPPGWPPPPRNLELRGVEIRQDRVRAARRALAGVAAVEQCNMRDFDFPPCAAIVLLDVLLYLNAGEQSRLLEKAARALAPDGLLLVREPDAGAGFKYQLTRCSAWVSGAGDGSLPPRLHCRRPSEWISELEGLGFAVSAEPMSAGTPFANVLFVARKAML